MEMLTGSMEERGRSSRSQRSSVYEHQGSTVSLNAGSQPNYRYQVSSTTTKRLFSNRYSTPQDGYPHNENDEGRYQDACADEEEKQGHSGKRLRNSEWPLPQPSPSNTIRGPLRTRNAQSLSRNSPVSAKKGRRSSRASSLGRPSKFLEGSMNDRVSFKPPIPYLEREEESDIEVSRGRKLVKGKRSSRAEGDESIAESRHSIFRFGKTIAASFNPTNWKIWSKDKGEDEEEKQLRILKERQEKAEKIYKELKDSGRFHDGAVGFRIYQDESEDQEMREIEEERGRRQSRDMSRGRQTSRASKMFDGARRRMSRDRSMSRAREISREDKRKGIVYLEPPNISVSESPAPLSTTSNQSPNKSSIFKKPSLRNIRNSFSNDSSTDLTPHIARRIPSRKDLHKQQKLVKRVSDLEGKLEHARRQLNQALGEPLAVVEDQPVRRPKFVPGALSSLPSERLLSGYVPDDEEGYTEDGIEEESEIGVAFSVDSTAITRNTQVQTESEVSAEWARIGASKASNAVLKEKAPPIALVEGLVSSVEKDDTASLQSATQAFERALEMKKADTVASTAPPSTISSKFDDPEDSDYQEPEIKKTPLKTKNVKQRKPTVNNAAVRHVSEAGKVEPEVEPASESDQDITPKAKPINSLLAFKDADSPSPKPAWNAGFGATTGSGGTKKRKSIFEREADDGGLYKPTKGDESESEVSSVPAFKLKKTTTSASSRPRKLQKLEFTDSLAKKATPRQSENGMKKEYGGLKNLRSSPAAISQITLQVPKDVAGAMAKAKKREGGTKPSGNKLTKSAPQPSQQSQPEPSHSSRRSESPSPSSGVRPSQIQEHNPAQAESQASNGSDYTGLQYKKPNTPPPRKRNSKLERDEIFTAAPGDDAGIPPMPRFPSTIRLSSGEIVVTNPFKDLEGEGFADVKRADKGENEVGRGLTKAKAMPKSPSNKNLGREGWKSSENLIGKIDEDFEWPEDVF